MSAARSLADVLRAVADRVDRGASFPAALREVATQLEDEQGGTPAWHLAVIDEALADEDDVEAPWDVALGAIRGELSQR